MKTINITIPGTTTSNFITDDNRPAISVFGEEGTGKSRFGLTMPAPIGYLALDRKAKRTIEAELNANPKLKGQVIVNREPFIGRKDLQTVTNLGDIGDGKREITAEEITVIKNTYKRITTSVWNMAKAFSEHPEIESIVVDRASQFFDWIMFAHFGRITQLAPMTQRSTANNYLVDFIDMCTSKNLLLIHGPSEIYKDTGRVDSQGNKVQEGTGRYRNDGWKGIGTKVEANLELFSKKLSPSEMLKFKGDEDAMAGAKFKARIYTCQANSMLEGQVLDEYGLAGKSITWENLMEVMGI